MILSFDRGRIAAWLLGAVVLAVTLLMLVGCGGQATRLPRGAVARVGSSVIEQGSVAHWVAAQRRSARAAGAGAAMVPDPPLYRRCVAELRVQLRAMPRPGAGLSGAGLLGNCRERDRLVREGVLQRLIVARWTLGEARDEHIAASPAAVMSMVRRLAGRRSLGRVLRATGLSVADLRFQARVQVLAARLRGRALSSVPTPTSSEVARFYRAHASEFGRPARRSVRVVMTATPQRAQRALAALRRGVSFARVAWRVSIDPGTRLHGGRLDLIQSSAPSPFESAVFAARRGRLYGPVQGAGGFMVFRVTRAWRAQRPSLAAAAPAIRRSLIAREGQRRLKQLADRLQRKWASRTACAGRSRCSAAVIGSGI